VRERELARRKRARSARLQPGHANRRARRLLVAYMDGGLFAFVAGDPAVANSPRTRTTSLHTANYCR